jgi:hypothetical protein
MTRYAGTSNRDVAGLSLYEKILRHTHVEDGHLIWDGSYNVQGYPLFGATENGKKLRVAVRPWLWRHAHPNGPKPRIGRNPEKCDRADCVLPDHQMDVGERPLKARSYRLRLVRGYRVKLIQSLGRAGYRPNEIAEGMSVPLSTVQRILNRI